MKLLVIGDIVGRPGRSAVKYWVPQLRKEFALSTVIANAENAASGSGITLSLAKELLEVTDVLTLGDHSWDQKGFNEDINKCSSIVRPANFSIKQPGKGYIIYRMPIGGEIAVVSLLGKVFMRDSAYCPFETIEKILTEISSYCKIIIVDFHAEATSEKIAMGYFLDGKVTAVLGTHTHVQTNDAQILSKGTAYLTDLGMCGATYSVLGRSVDSVLYKFTTGLPVKLPVEEKPPYRLDGAVIDFDLNSGKAHSIQLISRSYIPENS